MVELLAFRGGDISLVFLPKKSPFYRGDFLALLLLDFVSAEVFLSLGKDDVFPENRVVFLQRKFIRGVLRILLRIVRANTRLFRDEPNKFALSITFLCHIVYNFTTDGDFLQGGGARFSRGA